jgi:hypothetical protein
VEYTSRKPRHAQLRACTNRTAHALSRCPSNNWRLCTQGITLLCSATQHSIHSSRRAALRRTCTS